MTDYKKQGKKNLELGRRFENLVRRDLENKGWIVSRWQNNVKTKSRQRVEYASESYELVPARQGKFRKTSTGFPDFIAFRLIILKEWNVMNGIQTDGYVYEIIGVECKSNGYLTPEEREKCKWLLENKIFSKILIARKGKKRGEIIYEDFQEKYLKGGK